MSKNNLNFLYECIDYEKDVIEFMKTFEFHCKMFDLETFCEYTPLSVFDFHVRTINREHKMHIHFLFNARKKYLEKITLEYQEKYNIKEGYFKDHKVITSGAIAPDFMLPLEAAMKIISEY